MSAKKQRPKRRTRARRHCRHFDGTVLAGCARGGLEALESEHRQIVLDPRGNIGCSVCLDSCLKNAEPEAPRWDYILTRKQGDMPGVAVEVHPASLDELDGMIRKKEWAEALLAKECPDLTVEAWVWLIPRGKEVLFTRGSSYARQLAAAGLSFPSPSLPL